MAAYSIDDLRKINLACQEIKPWDSMHVKEFKSWLKKVKRKMQNEKCCYCLRDTHGERGFSLHLEHILPKSIFKKYMFDHSNLAVSCPRCNIEIKGTDYSFADKSVNSFQFYWSYKIYDSDLYDIVHPNLDNINSHIGVVANRVDDERYLQYIPRSDKGASTYCYFKLAEIEVKGFDKIQGVEVEESNSSVSERVVEIFKKYRML